MSKMMRINENTHKKIDNLARKMKKTKQAVIEKAIDYLAREQFIKQANEEYAELLKDPVEAKKFRKEMESWDSALKGGLKDIEN